MNAGATAPTITVSPAAVAVPPGGAATLTVVATGTAPLSYQWLKDGAVLAGATAATLGFPAVQGSDGALYAVRVSNAAGSATSAAAELTVASAGHAVLGAGYYAGGTVTLAQTATFSGAPAQVTWQLLLPAGWTVAGETSTGAASKPAAGTTDLAEWSWTAVPASPVTFRCTLNVPAGTTSAAAVSAVLTVRRADGSTFQILAQPEPLAVAAAARFHSADTDQDGRVSLVELTRVIELYNYRAGSVRTGQYRAMGGTEDGFAPGPEP